MDSSQHFFELSPDLLCVGSGAGELLRVNPAFTRILGYDSKGLSDHTFFSLVHADDLTRVRGAVEHPSGDGGAVVPPFEGRWGCRDGSFRWLEWQLRWVRNGQGWVFYGAGRDISERKRAEAIAQGVQAQLNSELELHDNLLENVPLSINVWQLKDAADTGSLTLINSNPAAQQSLGIGVDSMRGKTILQCFPNVCELELEWFGRVARREWSHHHYQTTYDHPDQGPRTYDVWLFAMPNHCLAVVFNDVSDRVYLAQQLRDHETLARTLFERAPIGFARVAPDGQWLEVNSQLCTMLGYRPVDLRAKTYQEITHPEDAAQDEVIYNRLISGATDTCVFEKRYRHAQGHFLWSNVSVSTLRKAHGELDCFIVTVEDISQRKATELETQEQSQALRGVNRQLSEVARELNQRNEELQQFAYVVSHDLKAPLRAIASLSEWLEEDLKGQLPAESGEHLRLIRSRIARMGSLLDGLLDYSRVGRQHVELETVDVAALLGEVVESICPPPGFEIEFVGTMPVLQTRRYSLRQVLANLIENGIKYCNRADGHLTVRVMDRSDHYEFAVQDNGPGIAPQHHQRIFTIFQTLQARDDVESTGVGLAIVKKILECEGGKIWVESTPGQGAVFIFTWPKREQELLGNG